MMKPARMILLLALPLLAQQRTFRIQPGEGAHLTLIVEKTRLMNGKKHQFTWSRYDGSLRFDRTRAANSTVSLIIQADSLQCRDTWVSASDLRKIEQTARKDMLGLPEHTQIGFVSRQVMQAAEGYTINGDLTIRGITRPVVLKVKLSDSGESLWIEGEGSIRLTEYGLKAPTAALGTIGTRDEMTLTFRVLAQ